MGSLGSLYVGVSGLNVSQSALNTTAHNLANVDTKGFVRQQVVLTDLYYKKIGETHISSMLKGYGSEFAEVRQVRDTFLDQSYRQENGRRAFYDKLYDSVSEVEGFLGELEGVPFQNTLKDFWESVQELQKEPENITTRDTLIQTASVFLERASNISKQLDDYQINLNTQIVNQVKRINEIGDELRKLNVDVRRYESAGIEHANDYRDQRNLLLDELSSMVNITYKETTSGMVNVNINGVQFISDDYVNHMDTAKISDSSDMLKPVWPSQGNMDVFNMDIVPSSANNTDIGSLRALLTTRGYKHANYTDIPKPEDFGSETQYNAAVLNYNNKIESSAVMSIQAKFDQLIHGIVTTMNDIFCPNATVTLNDGTDTKIKILDYSKAPVGSDPLKTRGEALFTRKNMQNYNEEIPIDILNEDGLPDSIPARVYNEEDPTNNYSLFTLGEIEINPNLLHNYSLLPLYSNTEAESYDIQAVNKLAQVWQDTFSTLSPNTLTDYNFNDYYNAFISDIANRGNQYDTLSKNQSTMVTEIDNQRMEVTGVSSDEELTNLIKYQHAYNASARYINVVDEMLEHIVKNL